MEPRNREDEAYGADRHCYEALFKSSFICIESSPFTQSDFHQEASQYYLMNIIRWKVAKILTHENT